jgi:hypothetical protein
LKNPLPIGCEAFLGCQECLNTCYGAFDLKEGSVMPLKRDRIIRRPFIKPVTATVDKVESILYSKHGKPLLMYRIQRQRPNPILAHLIPLSKNSNKEELFREGISFMSLVCFVYKDNEEFVYIAQGGNFIMIKQLTFYLLCQNYIKWYESHAEKQTE